MSFDNYIPTLINVVILIIIIIIINNQNKRISRISNQENFVDGVQPFQTDMSYVKKTITNEINRIYNMDTEAIRNLGAISKSLLTGTNYHSTTVGTAGTLTIPADNTVLLGDTSINKNISIGGTLSVNGSILLPPGVIMAWYKPTAPAGWGLCDGTLYGNIQSPDLRGRFIRMANNGTQDSYVPTDTANGDINTYQRGDTTGRVRSYAFGKNGGTDYRVMTVNEMPQHSHGYDNAVRPNSDGTNYGSGWGFNSNSKTYTDNVGGNWPFGVAPPYHVLVYIIKL